MASFKKGVIIIPACNEGKSLNVFLPQLKREISILRREIDVVVFNDGSTDNTEQVVKTNGFITRNHKENLGLGISLREGYKFACDRNYDFLVSMDGDGQHEPSILSKLICRLEQGADLVLASRYHLKSPKKSVPLDRKLLNIKNSAAINAFTGWRNITDALTGFWCMNQRVARFLADNLRLERYGTCLEALIKLWYMCNPHPVVAEVPHPAIYAGDGLNRDYSEAHLEARFGRFRDHASHILQALKDVEKAGLKNEIEECCQQWKKVQSDLYDL